MKRKKEKKRENITEQIFKLELLYLIICQYKFFHIDKTNYNDIN